MVETRVEKYKEYRKEIQSSFNDDTSTKRKTSDKIEKIIADNTNKENTSSLSFDEIINAHELYEKYEEKKESPLKGRKRVSASYLFISILICCILVAITIWLGILTFKG